MVVLVVQDFTDIVLAGFGFGLLTGDWLYYASGWFDKKYFNFSSAEWHLKSTLVVHYANYQTIFQGKRRSLTA
jgi:hypothetical protein